MEGRWKGEEEKRPDQEGKVSRKRVLGSKEEGIRKKEVKRN